MKEYKQYERIGTLPHRSYFIPFAADDKVTTVHGIVDRTSSSRLHLWTVLSYLLNETYP